MNITTRKNRSVPGFRVVFFGGKGGVGKTTCAAAYSVLAAQKGIKTLLVSTDIAHSLSDIFQKPIGHQITDLLPYLYGLEIDPDHEAMAYLKKIKGRVSQHLKPDLLKSFQKQIDLAAGSPGTQEAAMLDKISDLMTQSGQGYDLLVFDTAPTGQTIRILTLPDLMGDWFKALTRRRERVFSFWKMFERSSGMNSEEDPIHELLSKRREKFHRTNQILKDPSKTSFYFILLPERLSILETERAILTLKRYQIPIRGVIVNRILPEGISDPFLKKRKDQESSNLKAIESTFESWEPMLLREREFDIMSLEGLLKLASDLEPLFNRTKD